MSKKRLAIKILLLQALFVIVTMIITAFLVNFRLITETNHLLHFYETFIAEEFSKDSIVPEDKIEDIVKKQSEKSNFKIAIYDINGKKKFGTAEEYELFPQELTDDEIRNTKKEKNNTYKKISIRKKYYLSNFCMDESMYGQPIFIKVARNIHPNVELLAVALTLVFIFSMSLSVFLVRYTWRETYRGIDDTLNRIRYSIKGLKSGDYRPVPIRSSSLSRKSKIIINEINKETISLDKKIREDKVHNNRARFVMEKMGQLLFAVNDKDNIIINNTAAQRTFLDAGMPGQSFVDLFEKKDQENIKKILDTGRSFKGDYTIAGIRYEVEFIFLNIQELKELQDAKVVILMSAINDLNNEQANKNDFFSNVSHELKTPLTAILGYSELAINSDNIEKIKECNNEIFKNAERMQNLIRVMLDYAKVNVSLVTMMNNVEDINLKDVVISIFACMKYQIQKRDISTKLKGDAVLKGYRIAVEAMFKNLIENAIKYNKNSGLLIVELYQNNKQIIINIIDSGIGIPKEERANIYKSFYRVNKTSEDDFNSGLGLGIVKKAVDIHDGNISCASNEYGGTTFKIVFNKK